MVLKRIKHYFTYFFIFNFVEIINTDKKKINLMNFLEKTLHSITENPKRLTKIIVQGIFIGVCAGLIVCLYRFLLTSSENILMDLIPIIKNNFYLLILWFILLAIMGLITGVLMRWAPLATGSGIPQVNAEVKGYLNSKWWKVIIAKLFGGTLSTLGGLSLGREGPSIQLGAMAGKGISKLFKNSKTEEFRSIITGSAAGLAATFNAPLSGVIFSLEEINHSFDKTIIFIALIATILADFISKLFFGQSSIFRFHLTQVPLNYYWLFILLGLILGILGYIYNVGMIKGVNFVDSAKNIPIEVKLIITFIIVGIVSLFIPEILCGGHSMIEMLYIAMPPLSIIIFLLVAKYILSLVCFSSGAPGGILFPLLVLGAYIGAAFGSFVIPIFGLPQYCIYKFIIISMAGFFTATVRTPITGIVLISEMTGSTESLVASLIVCIIAYIIPTLLNNKPIYESLLSKILSKNEIPQENDGNRHILKGYIVPLDSFLIGMKIEEINLSNNSIIISILRENNYLIAHKDLEIKFADELYILIDQDNYHFENKEIISLINKNRKDKK